jgi:homoserine O-acetyltransferase
MGGMQLLEWAIMEPGRFENIIPIGTNSKHSPWGIALNASQRMAIESDCSWASKSPDAGHNGMKVARSIALLSYRDYTAYNKTQQGFSPDSKDKPVHEQVFRAETYQRYQGEKLAKRFNAFSYYALSRSMDSHDVGRNRGGVEQALNLIKAKTLIIGIFTDILFPPDEQLYLAQHIKDAEVHIINSIYGHDGFLLEFEAIEKLITRFLTSKY